MRGYNQIQYNTNRYNANGTELAFNDSSALVESFANNPDKFLSDFVFADDLFTFQFDNKALYDTLRLGDWISVERKTSDSQWYN